MKNHLKILLIDGDEASREIVKRLLKRSKLNVNLNEMEDCNFGGEIIKAQELFIITDVDNICLNFKTESEEIIYDAPASDVKNWLNEGHFWRGSMEPKIKAALYFLKHHGKEVIITSINNIEKAINNKAGTRIIKDK